MIVLLVFGENFDLGQNGFTLGQKKTRSLTMHSCPGGVSNRFYSRAIMPDFRLNLLTFSLAGKNPTRQLCGTLGGINKKWNSMKIEKIRELIGKDKIDDAIELINELVANTNLNDEFILLKNQYTNFNKNYHLGLISDLSIKQRIIFGFLKLTSEIQSLNHQNSSQKQIDIINLEKIIEKTLLTIEKSNERNEHEKRIELLQKISPFNYLKLLSVSVKNDIEQKRSKTEKSLNIEIQNEKYLDSVRRIVNKIKQENRYEPEIHKVLEKIQSDIALNKKYILEIRSKLNHKYGFRKYLDKSLNKNLNKYNSISSLQKTLILDNFLYKLRTSKLNQKEPDWNTLYDENGFDKLGFNPYGYNIEGYNSEGVNFDGYDDNGEILEEKLFSSNDGTIEFGTNDILEEDYLELVDFSSTNPNDIDSSLFEIDI